MVCCCEWETMLLGVGAMGAREGVMAAGAGCTGRWCWSKAGAMWVGVEYCIGCGAIWPCTPYCGGYAWGG